MIPIILGLVVMAHHCHCTCPGPQAPHAMDYIGIGYNMIEGNPEGGEFANGGVDPGLKIGQKIFKLSYPNTTATAHPSGYRIPKEAIYVPRRSTNNRSSYTTFHDASSYEDKLSFHVQVTGKVDYTSIVNWKTDGVSTVLYPQHIYKLS